MNTFAFSPSPTAKTCHFVRFSSSGINICCTSPLADLRKLYTVSIGKTSNVSTFTQVSINKKV